MASLYQELGTIDMFDRVHDLAPNSDPAEEYAYAFRQIRRSQIISEIKRLTAESEYKKAVALFCAVTLYYLFK